MLRVSDDHINSADELRVFETQVGDAGAIVSFSGRVRTRSDAGAVKSLFLQAYSPMTETGIETEMTIAENRWPLSALTVLHRTGNMSPGDTIVFVAAASRHRRAAFEAADFLMDYLKTRAVFWKKEVTNSGAIWIEPRAADYSDAARWSKEGTV